MLRTIGSSSVGDNAQRSTHRLNIHTRALLCSTERDTGDSARSLVQRQPSESSRAESSRETAHSSFRVVGVSTSCTFVLTCLRTHILIELVAYPNPTGTSTLDDVCAGFHLCCAESTYVEVRTSLPILVMRVQIVCTCWLASSVVYSLRSETGSAAALRHC